MCPRDTNTSQLVRRLYDAGAASLKLEGRMKAPDYVYSIVDVYRHQIDDMLPSDLLEGCRPPATARAALTRLYARLPRRYLGRRDDELRALQQPRPDCGHGAGQPPGQPRCTRTQARRSPSPRRHRPH
ncbi:MAG: U32 family peptidase [Collinsella sp.]